jgi:hypothetical protein
MEYFETICKRAYFSSDPIAMDLLSAIDQLCGQQLCKDGNIYISKYELRQFLSYKNDVESVLDPILNELLQSGFYSDSEAYSAVVGENTSLAISHENFAQLYVIKNRIRGEFHAYEGRRLKELLGELVSGYEMFSKILDRDLLINYISLWNIDILVLGLYKVLHLEYLRRKYSNDPKCDIPPPARIKWKIDQLSLMQFGSRFLESGNFFLVMKSLGFLLATEGDLLIFISSKDIELEKLRSIKRHLKKIVTDLLRKRHAKSLRMLGEIDSSGFDCSKVISGKLLPIC